MMTSPKISLWLGSTMRLHFTGPFHDSGGVPTKLAHQIMHAVPNAFIKTSRRLWNTLCLPFFNNSTAISIKLPLQARLKFESVWRCHSLLQRLVRESIGVIRWLSRTNWTHWTRWWASKKDIRSTRRDLMVGAICYLWLQHTSKRRQHWILHSSNSAVYYRR